ncbi:MAG: hypothetical protein ACD_34C00275G0006 [uncultured bacterium]|jgi:WXG100 family type VII secretion target|nr:MAG: hypothetical protein ACD_34C00275G0006 [uncultured bacterium]
MASNTVQVNYDEMTTIIKNMKSEQSEILQLTRQTKSKVDALHNNQWIGDAANKFDNEMAQRILPGMNRVASALGSAADCAQKIVNTIRDADEGTKSFFSNLG